MLYRLMQDSRIEYAMHRDVVDDVIFFTVQSVPIGSFCVRSIWYSFFALHQYRALMRGSMGDIYLDAIRVFPCKRHLYRRRLKMLRNGYPDLEQSHVSSSSCVRAVRCPCHARPALRRGAARPASRTAAAHGWPSTAAAGPRGR